jgi:hypothetical protein
MRVIDALKNVRRQSLTCSEVIELLASQPTANGTSHAHMHMCDGFRIDPARIIENHSLLSDPENRGERRRDWNRQEAHLFPPAQSKLERFDPARMSGMNKGRVYMDRSRQATDDTYISRTNLPEIPGVPEQVNLIPRYYVLRQPDTGRGKPAKIRVNSELDAPVPSGDTSLYVMDGMDRKVVREFERQVVAARVPRVPATTAHTMFEDSESMVMHLTAALKSDAGREVLKTLVLRGAGHSGTVGMFSKTAVQAVAAKIANVANATGRAAAPTKMDFRAADADANRNPVGTFTSHKRDFDHVVVVLAASPTFELVVVTCFPTDATTGASIGCPTGPNQDVAEHTFGQHTVVNVTNPLPTLTW